MGRRVFARVAIAWAAVCLLLASGVSAAELSVKAVVQPQRAQVGQAISLAIEIQGAQSVEAPPLSNLDGFDARYVGPSTQVQIVNGQMSASVTHRYALVPQREGVFQVGPFVVEHAGRQYPTEPVQVSVSAAADKVAGGAAGGERGDNLRLQISARDGDVYLHERVPIEVSLYIRGTQVSDVNFPVIASDGLSVESFPQPERIAEMLDGYRYELLRFRGHVTPLQPGVRPLGPATMRLSVVTSGGGFFAQKRQLDLQSNSVQWNVLPLPEAGRPADFSGAVGEFQLRVDASPTEVTAGDPVTVRIRVEGAGNLADARLPVLSAPDGLRTYDPQETKDDNPGVRVFEQVVIPESERIREIPPVRFSYFNPKSKAYRTEQSPAIPLQVRPAAKASAPQIVSAEAPVPEKVPETLGRDIVYIKDAPGDFMARGATWFGGVWTFGFLPVPLAALLAATILARRRDRLQGDAAFARFSRAGVQARTTIGEAQAALEKGDVSGAYDSLSRVLREYLAAKLALPVGAVDAEAAARCGLGDELSGLVRRFFEEFEQSRYSGRSDDKVARQLLEQAKTIIDRVEKDRSIRWPK